VLAEALGAKLRNARWWLMSTTYMASLAPLATPKQPPCVSYPPQSLTLTSKASSPITSFLCLTAREAPQDYTPLHHLNLQHSTTAGNIVLTFLDIDVPVKFSGFVVNVYFHEPNTASINELVDYLNTIPLGDNVVLMGDFNLSPSPSHSSYSLFSKLFKRLHHLQIVHQPTPFPTHHPHNFNNSPTHIDHIFVCIPSHMWATNIVREYRQSDHNSLTLYITPTEDSPSAESARNRTYNDPNFATFLMSTNTHQPLPQSYERFILSGRLSV